VRESGGWQKWLWRVGALGAFAAAGYGFLRTGIPGIGCGLGIAESCLAAGLEAEAENDPTTAKDYYERACTRGFAMGCNNLGVLYGAGKGVGANSLRAKQLYEAACSANEMLGCRNLGNVFFHGEGVEPDRNRGRELYDRACAGGNAMACNDAALARTDAADALARSALYSKACDGGSRKGCVNLARALLEGDGIAKDTERARGLLNQGCTDGHAESCAELGVLYAAKDGAVRRDRERARQLFARACEAEFAPACEAVKKLDDNPAASPHFVR
jgi:TPR repeat protein